MNEITNKNKTTYDALAKEYDQKSLIRKSFNSGVIDRFAKFIKTGKEVLDIGCAVGLDLEIFREKGFVPTGIELSKEMVKIAQDRNPNIEITKGNFMGIEIKKKFDAIWAQSFIHLFPKVQANEVLEKIKDSLKESGVAHITTTKSEESKEGWVEKTDYTGSHKRFRKHWTTEELNNSLKKIGFSVVDYYEIEDPFHKLHMVFTVKK